jgi:hypothetical protein
MVSSPRRDGENRGKFIKITKNSDNTLLSDYKQPPVSLSTTHFEDSVAAGNER